MLKVITRKAKNNLGFKIVDIGMNDVENEYKKVYDKLWRNIHSIIHDGPTSLTEVYKEEDLEVYKEEDLYDIVTEQDDTSTRCIITLSCTARREFGWKLTYKIYFYVILNNTRYPICTKVIDDANSSTEVFTHLTNFCSFMHW